MANVVYEGGLYNEEQKEEFLSQYTKKGTKDNYRRVLLKAYALENKLGKDVGTFTRAEVDDLVGSYKCPTRCALQPTISILNQYITWLISNGGISTGNHLDELEIEETWPRRHVYPRQFFSVDDIEQIEDLCVNSQDKVIFRLLFEGVRGIEYEEIVNLQFCDVDNENNQLRFRLRPPLDISDRLLGFINDAYKQDDYYPCNGEISSGSLNPSDTLALVSSNHILKRTKVGMVKGPKGTNRIVSRRLDIIWSRGRIHNQSLSEYFGIEKISPNLIWTSGMLWMAMKLIRRSGKLGQKQYEEIASVYSHKCPWSLKNKSITAKTVKDVYGNVASNAYDDLT